MVALHGGMNSKMLKDGPMNLLSVIYVQDAQRNGKNSRMVQSVQNILQRRCLKHGGC